MADLTSFLQKFNPDPTKAGKTLLYLNIFAMGLAGLANTFAVVQDKNTKPEDKKFLVPAGLATGVANIGIYLAMTLKIIDKMGKGALKAISKMDKEGTLKKHALEYTKKVIDKAETGLFKKSPDVVNAMKDTLIKDVEGVDIKNTLIKNVSLSENNLTASAIDEYKSSIKGGASVLGAFIGVILGCGILTPIIRDVSAFFIQKQMEKRNPEIKDKPYSPYFDPTHWKLGQNLQNVPKQPLTLKNYMAFTNGSMRV